jgi:hypothetical protein
LPYFLCFLLVILSLILRLNFCILYYVVIVTYQISVSVYISCWRRDIWKYNMRWFCFLTVKLLLLSSAYILSYIFSFDWCMLRFSVNFIKMPVLCLYIINQQHVPFLN